MIWAQMPCSDKVAEQCLFFAHRCLLFVIDYVRYIDGFKEGQPALVAPLGNGLTPPLTVFVIYDNDTVL